MREKVALYVLRGVGIAEGVRKKGRRRRKIIWSASRLETSLSPGNTIGMIRELERAAPVQLISH